ncbi:2400_t:CDS:2 [Diversispora eburnea]|uniref:2400_t:CDS:1 n=1 Tax=Diversispora eburnea TaxID=1213867 RepID=A0A9N8VDG7_9GLOM|nr:2400_t:CDS:2 [Diversispora eburnea]
MSSYFDFSNQENQLENCKIRTYAKTALHSCVVPQILTCSLRTSERKDIVFAKETVLELLEITREGTLVSIFEQPVFGTIKDIKVLHCRFSEPSLRVIPGHDVLVCLSDSGILSFIAKSGKFLSIKEIKLSEPGFDYKDIGRLVCIDPMGRYIAVAAWQNLFQLFSLTHDSIFDFDAAEHTNKYLIDGNIILHMTFLYPQDESSILLALVVFE